MTEELKPYIVPHEPSGKPVDEAALRQRSPEELGPDIVDALRTVYDPEIPVNIYDLGLIYGFEVDDNYFVDVTMTLTAPGCPVAETFPGIVENAVKSVVGVSDAQVELVFDPPWTMDNMSEEAKLELGMI
ncbi:SUF system Fe-S cluster assembly protein [Arenicella sp. 4NH20-0111]|uniref:SUF system Fe-S cluster assembly protein n=1 Tax=Arenicella sp. 4NH20-0111 TaxID=3127648 RepID=UPI0031079CA3